MLDKIRLLTSPILLRYFQSSPSHSMSTTVQWDSEASTTRFTELTLVEHYLEEPALQLPTNKARNTTFLIRKPCNPNEQTGIIARVQFLKHNVVWAAGENCYVARAKSSEGVWSPVFSSETANGLLNNEIIPFVAAGKKTKVYISLSL